MNLEERITNAVMEKLNDGTVEQIVKDSVENAIKKSLEDTFSWSGAGKKMIDEKVGEVGGKEVRALNAEEFKKQLDDMMLDFTIVIVCHPNIISEVEKSGEQLPPNTKLVPNNAVEENECYVIKDRELKRVILRNG